MAAVTILRKRPASVLDLGAGDNSGLIKQERKQYLRKTAKGKVQKILREHYLRSDIPCGSPSCSHCSALHQVALSPTSSTALIELDPNDDTGVIARSTWLLGKEGRKGHSVFKDGHYVILDTNVVLHQLDVLESSHFGGDIIILQTVLDEVRHRSLPLFNRLRALVADEDRRCWIFWNESRWDTFAGRKGGESPNDRNDRAIREAAQWYTSHLKSSPSASTSRASSKGAGPDVVLITDDADNRRKAQGLGLNATSLREYVENMPVESSSALLDLVAAAGASFDAEADEEGKSKKLQKRTVFYPEYLTNATLLAGIGAGKLHQGHFNPNPYSYLEGTVQVPNFTKPVLLVGREHMNRSVAGDIVVVEVFPESEWKAPTDEVLDQDSTLRNDDPDISEGEEGGVEIDEDRLSKREEVRAREKAERKRLESQPTGRVVGVIKRGWRSYVCHLDRTSLPPSSMSSLSSQSVFATPLDRKIPKIRIRTRQAPSLLDQKFLVTVDAWPTTSRYPEGHFVRSLGKVESKEAEIESLLLEWDVPYRPFSKAILDCLPKEGDAWVVPPKAEGEGKVWKGREDLRHLLVCSIDPPGCQDIDDALHARLLPNGNVEAGVHIADVSHFVHPDNPMDAEAASRGTTVYLVDKRIDMLPSLLGTNLCSLRPNVERLAFSVLWELDDNANIVNVRFTKSVIDSKSAFTYEEAQIRKDDTKLQDDLTKSIRLLNALAIKLKAKRMAAGALNLASPEVKIHMESAESTEPIDVEQKEMRETNSLVEEFMLLANISVAQRIYDQFPHTAVLRRHMPPPKTNFEVLQDVLKKRKGLSIDVSSSRALADSLDTCTDPNEPAFNTLVRIMATRCMLSAEYFCSGSVARDSFGHYGLASPIYTHFTSPIRRYADVLVHRQLTSAIAASALHPSLHSKSFVEKILENVNKRHRSAQQAGRASVEFYVGLALRGREEAIKKVEKDGMVVEEAYVIRAFKNGLAVFVSKFGLEGLVTFKRENKYDPENYEISVPVGGESRGGMNVDEEIKIGVFDKVKVQITVEEDKSSRRGKVKMFLVEPVDSRSL